MLVGKYFYDGEGKRVKKKTYDQYGVEQEEVVFVYDAMGKLVAEYSTKTPPSNLPPTTNYTATDQLGSPRVITNSLGEVVSRRDFMPFGEELTVGIGGRSTNLKYGVSDSVRQRFTGYQKDEETGLDFAEARMYENRHGRFTAVDPLLASGKSANPQTFNRYVYVMNNPLAYTDSSGLQAGTPAGRWFRPREPDGVRTYIYASSQPDGYEEVTERNRGGDLIGSAVGLPEGYVYRFNPAGPMSNIALAAAATAGMYTSIPAYDRNGFEEIMSDESLEQLSNTSQPGRVDNVFSPLDVALFLTPLRFSVGGRSSLSIVSKESSTLAGFGSDAAIVENSANLIPKKGWYDAVVHGTKDGQNFVINGNVTTPKQFYGTMLENGYKPGTNIRLMSCFAGSCSNGAAQQLSNLARAKVVAPADEVWVGSGALFPRGVPYVKNDKWFSVFRPR